MRPYGSAKTLERRRRGRRPLSGFRVPPFENLRAARAWSRSRFSGSLFPESPSACSAPSPCKKGALPAGTFGREGKTGRPPRDARLGNARLARGSERRPLRRHRHDALRGPRTWLALSPTEGFAAETPIIYLAPGEYTGGAVMHRALSPPPPPRAPFEPPASQAVTFPTSTAGEAVRPPPDSRT